MRKYPTEIDRIYNREKIGLVARINEIEADFDLMEKALAKRKAGILPIGGVPTWFESNEIAIRKAYAELPSVKFTLFWVERVEQYLNVKSSEDIEMNQPNPQFAEKIQERDALVERLDKGMTVIYEARETKSKPVDVIEGWITTWLGLLEKYKQVCDEIAVIARPIRDVA